jgi:hypothetical protein
VQPLGDPRGQLDLDLMGLTGDAKLKGRGELDQAVGQVKQKVEEVVDKVKDAIG